MSLKPKIPVQHTTERVAKGGLARSIGARIRAARLAAGLTQQGLAAERYTKAYISALENGLSKPSMAALTFIADRLGLPTSRFLEDELEGWTRLQADLELAAGRWQQAVDGYQALLERPASAGTRAELLLGLAEGYAGLDRGRDAVGAASEAAHLFAGLGRGAEEALSNYWLSCGQYQLGNTLEARALLEGILARLRAGLRVEPDFQARVLMALSSNASLDGEHAAALAYLEEIRDLTDGLDDRRRGVFLFDLAFSYRNTGDFEAAIRAGTAGLALLRAAQAEFEAASLQRDLALSYLALGNDTKAEQAVRSARDFFERLGDRRWLSYVTDTEAQIALARGEPHAAAELAARAVELAEETSNEIAILAAVLTLARARRAQGLNSEAAALYERAADLARREGKPARIRQVLGEFAETVAGEGDHERAFALMREAV
ncbi:MAG TPA: helix-turn-helix transcriptional regulator, partial [Candidatus Sulfomarinibacteraceae bacterium]|nr:helix-turn-helix transcriptional regulator [Candidatus Sulfomarinibacteraceae bacterium]